MPPLPHAFIINLPEATERLRVITQSMPAGIAYTVHAAQRGAAMGDSHTLGAPDHPFTFTRPGDLQPNEFACKMAHLSIMDQLLHSSLDHALVFEDDVRIPPGFDWALQKLMAKLPTDYDIVYLSYNTDMHINVDIPGVGGMNLIQDDIYCERASIQPDVDPLPLRANRIWGIPAYLLSKSGANKILALARETPPTTIQQLAYPFPDGMNAFDQPMRYCPTGAIDLFILANLYRLNGFISCPMIAYPNMHFSTSMIGSERSY